MKDNIIKTSRSTIIMNGGDPLKDCPTDWDKAHKWADQANNESEGDWERPEWKWDCGFKLDYDGPILRIHSRFYPPKTHYGATWDGDVDVFVYEKKVHTQSFDCETLEDLKSEVEKFVSGLRTKMESFFTSQ